MDKLRLKNRPRNLHEVIRCYQLQGDFYSFLREFLDEFYTEKNDEIKQQMLSIEPKVDANKQINAYLGAVAEHLSIRYYLDTPGWANDYSRFLDEEFFPCQLESSKIRDLLRRESPSAFRRRMIYVDKDPLYRPRRQLT